MNKILIKIKLLLEKIKFKKNNIYIRSNVKFQGAKLGGNQKIGEKTNIKNSNIGFGSYIGKNCMLENIKIGKYCSLGDDIKVISGIHPLEYVSTHPFSHSSYLKKEGFNFKNHIIFEGYKKVKNSEFIVEIGNDVWIGTRVTILGGVKIEDGAVIGCGAVVTKDVKAYSIVVGVPAKIIKYRFEKKDIEYLKKEKWWDKDIKWIEKNIEKFSNIEKFKC